MTKICLFPGQGSQSAGMGAALFDRYDDWTAEADRCLGYSVRELCVSDPRDELRLTKFTQPALYVVNALTYRARAESGVAPPDYVAGHSLGEFNALLAADVFDFPTGLQLVRRRGEIMSEVTGGGMAAVVGLEPARIREVLEGSDVGRRLDVANFNSFDQTVIAGTKDDLVAVRPDFEAAGVRAFISLKVSAPFHSRYMQDAQREFQALLDDTPFRTPSIPVVANVTGTPYEPDRVRETLSAQIGSSVRWLDSMLYLLDRPEPSFEEVGPGTVLTKLVAQIRRKLGR